MMNDESVNPTLMNQMVSTVQGRLTQFYSSLPASLAFNHETFKTFSEHGQGSVLLLLHLMFHGSNALVHWPSLFREFDSPVSHSIDVAYASSRSLVDCLIIAKAIDANSLLTNPFFDVPVSVAARAFLAARSSMGVAVAKNPLFNRAWNESNLETCMDFLSDMSQYWGGAAVVRNLLEQRGANCSSSKASALNSKSHSPPTNLMISVEQSSPDISPQSAGDNAASLCSLTTTFGLPTPTSVFDQDMFFNLPATNLTPRPWQTAADGGQTSLSDDIFGSFFGNHLNLKDGGATSAEFTPQTFDSIGGAKDDAARLINSSGITSSNDLLTPRLENSLFPQPTTWMSML